MPEILFVSNNISHWPLSRSSSLAGSFDSTRVPYSIALNYAESIASPEFPPVSAGTVTWIHFRTYVDGLSINDELHMLRVFDANQNLLCQVNKLDSVLTYFLELKAYDNANPKNQVAGFPINKSVLNSIDVKIDVAAGYVKTSLYINGGLAAVSDWATNSAGYGVPTHFALGAAFSSAGGSHYFSEVLVSDSDTRNVRMSLLRPVASGGETDWVGVVAELADDDPTSGMTTTAANQRQTLTLGAYAGASNISSVVVASQTMAGAGAPQNLRHTVRMSTINYDGPTDIPLSEVLQYDITDFQINPATSLPWVAADLATLEVGFISKV
jgi:hypothetical protein